MVEWRRRLDDFDKKGWHNIVEVQSGPEVEYVGLVNSEDDAEDRVVVRLEAEMRDCVEIEGGTIINKDGAKTDVVSLAEYWTLARERRRLERRLDRAGRARAATTSMRRSSPSPWSDEQGLKDETALERRQADAPQGVTTAELADVDYAGDARKQALDLCLADERFAPHVLEAAARTAMAAWAEAVDGDDAKLRALAGDEAVQTLLYGGDTGANSRLVVRGPKLSALRIAGLDPDAQPADARRRGRGQRPPLRRGPRHARAAVGQPRRRDHVHRALDAAARRHRRGAVADRRGRAGRVASPPCLSRSASWCPASSTGRPCTRTSGWTSAPTC